jgi:hypothetical protein
LLQEPASVAGGFDEAQDEPVAVVGEPASVVDAVVEAQDPKTPAEDSKAAPAADAHVHKIPWR